MTEEIDRRSMLGVMGGGAAAMAGVSEEQPQSWIPPPNLGAAGSKFIEEKVKEPNIAYLRQQRAKLEAQARGEGFLSQAYVDMYDRPQNMNLQSLRSVSPSARCFIGRRRIQQEQFERYIEQGKQELERFLKNWAWKLL